MGGALVAAATNSAGAASPLSPGHRSAHVTTLQRFAGMTRHAAHHAPAVGVTAGTVHYAVETPTCAAPKPPDYYTCFAVRRTPASQSTKGAVAYVAPRAATGPAGGYTPSDLMDAYGYTPKKQVAQTIGIVDWYDDPHAVSDLNVFDRHYGFPTETRSTFRTVNQNGRVSPLPKANKGTAGEITLDIQAARAVCQKCRILLVEANGPTDRALARAENTAVRLGATEVSNSYGSAEASHPIAKSTVQAYDHPGVVITASTGDDGWFGWDLALHGSPSQNSPSFPSSDPVVAAVGGTLLGVQNHKRVGEAVWNEDAQGNSGATGGGCSTEFTAPRWQRQYLNYPKLHCGGSRLAADVSAIADPALGFDVYQTYGGTGWETVGGTSLSAPLTAAMWALAGGARGAVYPVSALYENARLHPGSVYDVMAINPQQLATGNSFCAGESPQQCYSDAGGNPNGGAAGSVDCSLPRDGSAPSSTATSSRECNVTPGFDGPTGLGTPKSLRLFTATTPTLSVTHPHLVRGKRATFHLKSAVRVLNTSIKRFLISWGDGSQSTSHSPAVAHTYTRAGTHLVTVTVLASDKQETFRQLRVRVTH